MRHIFTYAAAGARAECNEMSLRDRLFRRKLLFRGRWVPRSFGISHLNTFPQRLWPVCCITHFLFQVHVACLPAHPPGPFIRGLLPLQQQQQQPGCPWWQKLIRQILTLLFRKKKELEEPQSCIFVQIREMPTRYGLGWASPDRPTFGSSSTG